MAFAMDISMGFTMHIILTFGSMGFAMLTSMGFAMPSWHSWCTMYTEHFSSLDLSTVSKWLHHFCSHPPPLPHSPQLHFLLSPLQFAICSNFGQSHQVSLTTVQIKGTILAIGHWPEMAKIRDEPRKIIPTSETENISQDKYLLYFYKLWVFIYFKWLSDRPQSASFWVKATFLFYSTDKIPWNHHSPLISITGLKRESGFYFFENGICTNCECSSIWGDDLIDHNQPHSG